MTAHQGKIRSAVEMLPNYKPPQSIFIGGSARKLYQAEERRSTAIKTCATEYCRLAELDHKDQIVFWKTAIPQALFDTLDSFETSASITAAKAFLEHYGFTVTAPNL